MSQSAAFEQCSEEAQAVIEAYFRTEYKGLLSLARREGLPDNLAEEAVQETFVCFARHYEDWKQKDLGVGWLYGVLKKIVLHIQRDEKRIGECISLDDAVVEPGREDPGFLFALVPKSDPDFQLVWKFYYGGASVRELADELGITVGACKVRILRAKRKIQERYGSGK